MSTPTPTPTPTASGTAAPPGGQQVPLPHELTAEWTVRAHLTFARAGETVQKEFSAPEAVHPVRVVYKWSTPFEDPEAEQDADKVIPPLGSWLKRIVERFLCRPETASVPPILRPPPPMLTLPSAVPRHPGL